MNAPQVSFPEQPSGAADFSRDGFTGPVRLFTAGQCALIVESLRRGARPDPLDWPKGRGASDRFFYDLATRPGLLALLRPLLGPDIVLWGVDVVERDPGQIHPWHVDIESAEPGRRFVSAWIGIQNTSRESSLQMIVRSHDFGKPVQQVIHEHGMHRGEASDDTVLAWARDCDPLAALVQPDMTDGEAILYDGRLWHATSNTRPTGRRIALLLQFASADTPVFIPDFSRPGWPFHFRETRPPVVVVSGRGDDAANRFVPPPPACPESDRVLSTAIHRLDLPMAEDPNKQWRCVPLLRASTPVLQFLGSHISVLSPGYAPHPIHAHANEELRIVLEGDAEVLLGDGTSEEPVGRANLPTGSFSYTSAHLPHAVRNPHAAPATYLVLYWHGPPLETDSSSGLRIVQFDEASTPDSPDPFVRKLLIEQPTAYLTKLHAHLSTLQPGAGYDPHVDEYDVAIVLLSGKIETLGRIVEGCGVIYYAAGEAHGMRNVGEQPARYLVFEFHAPRRSPRNRVAFRVPPAEQIAKHPKQDVRAFWTGPPLSAYEELGLLSFVARGQRVLLYSYDRTLRVPDGVELIDANEVLPADRIHEFIHPNGETSPTLHANLFRYEALRRFGGWYCDLDIVLVGDTPPDADVYLAREDDTFVNNAVLRFPPNAPLMVAASQAARELMTSAEWGASGPKLLTRLIAELGLSDLVQPWTAAYPVRPTEVAKLFLPEHRDELEDRAAGADFVHLWNQVWRRVRLPKDLGPPEGSFLDSLFRSFGIHVAPGARMSPRAVASWFGDFNFTADARRLVGETSGLAELAQALEQVRSGRNSDQRLADLAAALHEARWERDELLKSTSWRATAPLRKLSEALRGLLGRS